MAEMCAKPTLYTGSGDWCEWLFQFQLSAEINGWNDENKSLFMGAFATRAYKTVNSEARDELSRDRFLAALGSNIRLRVRQEWPKTLNAAVSLVLEMEAIGQVEAAYRVCRVSADDELLQPIKTSEACVVTQEQHKTEQIMNMVMQTMDTVHDVCKSLKSVAVRSGVPETRLAINSGSKQYRVEEGSVEPCSAMFVEGKLWDEPIDLLIDTATAVSFRNEKVWQRASNGKLQPTNRVNLKETIVILSRHEVLLQEAVSANMGLRILETNRHLFEKHVVFLARVLVPSKDKAIPVRLLNPHPQSVTLYSGTNIGSLMPCVMSGTVGTGDKTTRGEKASCLFDLDLAKLSPTQRLIAEAMFNDLTDVCSWGSNDLGRTNLVYQEIDPDTDIRLLQDANESIGHIAILKREDKERPTTCEASSR
uniref:Uncharacterized protein n=1 Tax=Timema cristinae TaxID=61476 RepID=A0A7R9DKE7_TIMCR|nr:unnamed protein product [Timema cristinae]